MVRKGSVLPYFEMKGAPGALRIAFVARAKSSEILGCPRHHVRKQFNDNPSFHVSTDADVHEHSRIWLRRDHYIHSSIRFFSIIHAQILHRFHGHVDPRRTRTTERNSSNPPRQNPPSNSTVALSHLTLEGSNNIPTLQPVKLIVYSPSKASYQTAGTQITITNTACKAKEISLPDQKHTILLTQKFTPLPHYLATTVISRPLLNLPLPFSASPPSTRKPRNSSTDSEGARYCNKLSHTDPGCLPKPSGACRRQILRVSRRTRGNKPGSHAQEPPPVQQEMHTHEVTAERR